MINKFLSIDKKAKYIFHWILLYLLFLFIGCCITLVVTHTTNKNLQSIALYDMEYYIQHGDFNPNVAVNGANNFIFNSDGELLDSHPTDTSSGTLPKYIQRIFPKVQENGIFYSLRFTYNRNYPLAVVTAYPIDEDEIFVFIRNSPSFFKNFLILVFTTGLVVLLVAIYLYLVVKMDEKNKKMQRNYIDNITHELKSPIASVKALTETMYDGLVQDEEKRKRYYKIILNEMSGLESTVTSMLELSRIQNKQTDCNKTQVSVTDIFADIIEKYAALCDERQMQFSIHPYLSPQCMVCTNISLASRMLDILLDNAVKFAGVHGCVHIEFIDDGQVLTIHIRDNGPGIHPEEQKLIFNRFYKTDKSHNEKGSGLGLSIATEIANSLDEKLWLVSSGADGTEFAFTLHK